MRLQIIFLDLADLEHGLAEKQIKLSIIAVFNITITFQFYAILSVLPPSCFLAVRLSVQKFCSIRVASDGKDILRKGKCATVDLLCTT